MVRLALCNVNGVPHYRVMYFATGGSGLLKHHLIFSASILIASIRRLVGVVVIICSRTVPHNGNASHARTPVAWLLGNPELLSRIIL